MTLEPKPLFKGIEQAKVSARSDYFQPGRYICRINNIKTGTTQARIDFFCVEMTVMHVLDDKGNPQHNRPGSDCSHMMMSQHLSFLGNVKAFAASVMECSPNDITPEICTALCAPDQPLRGTLVELDAKIIETRKKTPFTLHTYKGVVPAARLKELINPKIKELFYPGTELEDRIAREAQIAAEQAAEAAKAK